MEVPECPILDGYILHNMDRCNKPSNTFIDQCDNMNCMEWIPGSLDCQGLFNSLKDYGIDSQHKVQLEMFSISYFSIKLSQKGANSVIGYLGTKMPFHIQPVVVMGQYSVILILGSALVSAGLVTHYVALSKLIISFNYKAV